MPLYWNLSKKSYFPHDQTEVIGFWEKLSCHFHHIISKVPFYDLSDIDVGHLAEIVFVRLFHYKIMILIY